MIHLTATNPASITVALIIRPEFSFLTLIRWPLVPSIIAAPFMRMTKAGCVVLIITLSPRLMTRGSVTLFNPRIAPAGRGRKDEVAVEVGARVGVDLRVGVGFIRVGERFGVTLTNGVVDVRVGWEVASGGIVVAGRALEHALRHPTNAINRNAQHNVDTQLRHMTNHSLAKGISNSYTIRHPFSCRKRVSESV